MKHLHTILGVVLAGVFLALASATAQEATRPPRQIIDPTVHSVTVTNLGNNVNSYADDFAPIMTADGVMYFTSGRTGAQDMFSTVQTSGGWGAPRQLGAGLNTGNPEGGMTITPDGHWMFFTACDREDSFGDCDLYIAEYLGGAWRNITNLGEVVNSEYWESHPAISPDGLTLYFASDRPGGRGGTDIWITERDFGGEWKAPKNMGMSVNSPGNEVAPYIGIDNNRFFFSSDDLPGIGGLDVYTMRRQGTVWTLPENAGVPLNSGGDDYFVSLHPGTDNVFFASDRAGGEGGLDIYLAAPNPFPPNAVTTVKGVVSDARTNAPLGAMITVSDLATNRPVASFHSDDTDGEYTVILQPGRSYAITAQAPGYLFYSDRFDVPADAPDNTMKKDIKMSKELTRLLVFFDFDKATLKRESNVDLDNAAVWLKSNPNLTVELSGHTDNVGSNDYNQKLSQDRANSVKTYLVSKGVDGNRINAVGYGMTKPVASNDTDEGRARNRRVEFRVISQ